MKNIKDTILSIFAVIGFVAILSSFTNQPESEVSNGTPESHIWSFHMDGDGANTYAFAINAVTGEVRKYNSYYTGAEGGKANANFDLYRVTKEK